VRYRPLGYLSAGGASDRMLLPRANFPPAASPPPRGHLLHREEGIDLRLSQAARPQGFAEKVAYPGQRS